MYCYPYPPGSTVPPLKAPYIAKVEYRLGSEHGFAGFHDPVFAQMLLRVIRPPHSRITKDELLAFNRTLPSTSILQSWLFFGLASEALGRDVKHEEFLRPRHKHKLTRSMDVRLPAKFWLEYRSRWINLRAKVSEEEYENKRKHLAECCQVALLVIWLADAPPDRKLPDMSVVVLSIYMLLQVLHRGAAGYKLINVHLHHGSTELLVNRMVSNGWCKKRLNFLHSSVISQAALYFLSSFRPIPGKTGAHVDCTKYVCNVHTQLQEPRHITKACTCQNIQVPLDKVCAIIQDHEIPLIRIRRLGPMDFELEVLPYDNNMPYTAISHVWADRQFGSTENGLPACRLDYLEASLSSLPIDPEHMTGAEWVEALHPLWFRAAWRWWNRGKTVTPDARQYQYFWLDTFCIPQDAANVELRHKAIEAMNLIYASSSQTLVFDSSIQSIDAGKRPAALLTNGQDTFSAPADKNVLAVLANICACEWMGRAWTLQEGVLSHNIIFPLQGSLTYLNNVLMSGLGEEEEVTKWDYVPYYNKIRSFFDEGLKKIEREGFMKEMKSVIKGFEPMHAPVRQALFKLAEETLNVEDYRRYTRKSVDRTARFINAHTRLQSRTTTMSADLPLILANMSGLNGNLMTSTESRDRKFQLLYYGLGRVPLEVLFSDCERIGSGGVDSWIPCEVAPETFKSKRVLELGPQGFALKAGDGKGNEMLWMFEIVPSLVPLDGRWIALHDSPDRVPWLYGIATLSKSHKEGDPSPAGAQCILLEMESSTPRGAVFNITKRHGNTVYLDYDRPVQLTRISKAQEENNPLHCILAVRAHLCSPFTGTTKEIKYILNRSPEQLDLLSTPRPQNATQLTDRFDFYHEVIMQAVAYLFQRSLGWLLRDRVDVDKCYWLMPLSAAAMWYARSHVRRGMDAVARKAWVATFAEGWSPRGRWWAWWAVSNYEPQVGFRALQQVWCGFLVSLAVALRWWSGLLAAGMCYLALFGWEKLVRQVVIGLVSLWVTRVLF